jgi:methionine aminotransferase
MSELATKHGAVNLGQGFPDFDMPQDLIELVAAAMRNGSNQYTHLNGYLPLREAIAGKVAALYGNHISPDSDIIVTPGGTYAIYTALTTILHKGDEVIVFEPCYDSYIPNIEINGAVAVTIPLQFPTYSIPWDEVRKKITARTKCILINSPHNPTGTVLSKNDIEQLRQIVADTQIIILSDEVYEHLIYDGLEHQSILRYPDLLARSFVCFSFGKTYHATGWKLGYCIGDTGLMEAYRKVHQFNAFCADTPKQVALATYMENKDAYLQLGAQMQVKRDYFRNLMKATTLKCLPSNGSYFECYSYANISDASDTDFAMKLIQEYGVATIPVSAFYKNKTDNKVIRFCFAKKEETLQRALEKLVLLK